MCLIDTLLYSGCTFSLFFKQRFSYKSWFEVDLGEITVVSGVIAQGMGSTLVGVTRYNVTYRDQSSTDYDDVIYRNGTIQVHQLSISLSQRDKSLDLRDFSCKV